MASLYSYDRYDQVPIVCRAMFTLYELVETYTCPDPQKALTYARPRRLTRDEEKKRHPERWRPKACEVCGRTFKRDRESWVEWQKRIVCGRQCGATYRAQSKQTVKGLPDARTRGRQLLARLRNGLKARVKGTKIA